jgi:hypothetical protein
MFATAVGISLVLAGTRVRIPAAPREQEPGEPIRVPREIEKQIRAGVPGGWTVTIKGDTLTVRRDQPVKVFRHVPNEPPRPADFDFKKDMEKRAVAETYAITLHFRQRVSPEKYREWQKVNARRTETLEEWRRKLRAAQVAHKFDDYVPTTPEQKRLVAEYRKAQKEIPFRRLPNGYTPACSVDVRTSLSGGFGWTLIKKAQNRECGQVNKRIVGLFRTY